MASYIDHRLAGPAEAPVVYLEDGSEELLPTKWAVCPVCNGEGRHINPAIDCDGITAEDFDDDPDFKENYLNGLYDQTCNKCRGRTTVAVVDEKTADPTLLKLYEEQEEERWAAVVSDRRAAALGY